MNRRRWALGAAGLAAAAAGVAWQRWRESPTGGTSPGEAAFWQAQFERLDGTPLPAASLRGRPLVLNFWGTWCPPCVKEMPELDRFQREFAAQGWQVLGLAVDNPSAVREFLGRRPVGYTIALAGFEGSGLSRDLGNDQGALPYTVAFDRAGRLVRRKLGPTNHAELAAWAQSIQA